MLRKYVTSLAIAVFLVTLLAANLRFATNSQVLSGKALEEKWDFEFTLDADSNHMYEINPNLKSALESGIAFAAEGVAHVASSTVDITPKTVSWSENRQNITAPGAAMVAHVKWDTPADSANGARGKIYITFPPISGLPANGVDFHSGGYQKDGQGRWIVREVTTYRNSVSLFFGRFAFALAVGLPFAILAQSVWWAFQLKAEKKARIAAFPQQSGSYPRTFFPNPIAEWSAWTLMFGIFAVVGGIIAAVTIIDGFLSPPTLWFTYGAVLFGALIAFLIAYLTQRNLMTVRVEADGLSYARGRGEPQWATLYWTDVLTLSRKERTYRGNRREWLEFQFKDAHRKNLKIQQDIIGYPALRDWLWQIFSPSK